MAALTDLSRCLLIQEGDGLIAGRIVVALMAAHTMRCVWIFGLPLREKDMEMIVHVARGGDVTVTLQTVLVTDRCVERRGLRRMSADPRQQIARAHHE